MADNPYMVGTAPNYAAPLVDLFKPPGSQRNNGQQQGQQDPSASAATQARQGAAVAPGAAPRQTFAQYLQSLFGGGQQPGQPYQPNGPLNIDPNSTIPGVGPGGPSGIY